MKKLILLGLFLLVMSSFALAKSGDTGLDVTIRSYGLELISYQTSTKYIDNTNHFIVLEIVVKFPNNQLKTMNWIMLKERYNELKEKV